MKPYLGMPILETERLILRKFVIDDAEDVYRNWASDEETCTYLTWNPHVSLKESRDAVCKWIAYYEKSGYYWAIERKDVRDVIGDVFVFRAVPAEDLMEIGICIGKRYWRQGYGKEAAIRMMRFLFEEAHVGTILAKHDDLNIASRHLLPACGLNLDKNYSGSRKRRDGTTCTLLYYSASRQNWLEWEAACSGREVLLV